MLSSPLSKHPNRRSRTSDRGLIVTLVLLLPLVAAADRNNEHPSRFGDRIAGLYLAVGADDAHVFQLDADGGFSYMESQQFGGWPGSPSFSDEMGTWRKTGRRTLVSTSFHLEYWTDGGAYAGISVLRRTLEFDRKLRSFAVVCSGDTYAPGVDPFDPEAEANSSFECPPRKFQRIRAGE
ncbi:MAG: hypothetical protein AAEJ53_21200 [Myxococcota bacterium]